MQASAIEELSGACLREFAYLMTGDQLGNGMSRVVVEHPFDASKVIKIENSANHFQNVMEWQIWDQYRFCKEVSRWLAPCHAISHSGTFLIMEKARDLLPQEKPKQLPTFLTDHKLANYGMIGKRVVCRDYGTCNFGVQTRLRKWQGD